MTISQDAIRERLLKMVKTSSTQLGTEDLLSDVPYFLSTGCMVLDLALGGGIPGRRVVEIFSNESEGKTTLACHILASAQNLGGSVMIIDSETTIDRDHATSVGMNMDNTLMFYASSVEDGFTAILELCNHIIENRKDNVITPYAVLWDTLAMAPTMKSKEGRFAGGMADKARVIRECFSVITVPMAQAGIALILNNHVIASMSPYAPVTTPGGSGPKFASTHRIYLKKSGIWSDPATGETTGIIVKVKINKNKISAPFKIVEIPMLFETGIHNDWALFNYAYASDLIERRGSYYYIHKYITNDDKVSFHHKEFLQMLQEYPESGLRLRMNVVKSYLSDEEASLYIDKHLLQHNV